VSNRLDYNQVAPAGISALGGVYGYVMQSSLPTVLADLVYLRASQNCAYRFNIHKRDLLRKGQAVEKIAPGRRPAIFVTPVNAPRLHGPKR
jgi:alkylhydroperoxidase family enzyme